VEKGFDDQYMFLESVETGIRGSSILWSKWRERKGWARRHAVWESCVLGCASLPV